MNFLRRIFCVMALLLWPCGFAQTARAADLEAAVNFGDAAETLAQLIACAPGARPASAHVDPDVHNRYCAQLTAHAARYLRRYHKDIRPVLAQVVPHNEILPVVYPFGGGDLLTALGTFPQGREMTTLSLEPAGDIRGVSRVNGLSMESALMQTGDNLRRLLAAEHSKTTNLSNMAKGLLPAEIAFSLFALRLWNFDVTGFRYFDLDSEGKISYLGAAELAALDDKIAKRRLMGGARAQLFANVEITFRRAGETHDRVFRHLAGNLADTVLRKDDRVLKHLRAKGNVFAMTKAASYLLWWDGFGLIRSYLAESATFMISDSTGLPPHIASANGFSQTTYGWFSGAFLPGANRKIAAAFAQQWKTQPIRPIHFHYGYPDVQGRGHMLVTRRDPKAR